ncbi:hypothetical protein BHM03_00033120 [Ensete ventricosum]|nr:hypothetical protein BHM03_00033120 [Ensete ventricosum]
MNVISLLSEMGGRLVLLMKSRLNITALNLLPVDIVGSGSGAPGLLAPTAGNEIDTLPRRTSTRSEAGQVHKERRRRIGLHEKRGEQGSGSRLTMVDSGEELQQCSRRGG